MVDILMATYNGEKYIEEQISSIINQTYKDWTLYIHDDGSTDETIEIIKKFNDSRIILIEDGLNFGNSSKNFLHLLTKYVKNEFFFFSDQDDYWMPDKIERTLEFMNKLLIGKDKSLPVCIGTDLKVVDSNLNEINPSFYNFSKIIKDAQFNDLLIENVFTGCTMCMNRAIIPYMKKCDLFFDGIVQHDWLIGLICASDGYIGQLPNPTMLYRQHQNNVVGANAFTIKRLFDFSTMMVRLKKIKKLRESVIGQMKIVELLIQNKKNKFLIQSFTNSSFLNHKICMLKNRINRSCTIIKEIVKLILY